MHRSSVPLFWRLKESKYRMVGTKCASCNSCFFPPKSFCPGCRRQGKTESHAFSGKGTIVTYTIIRAAPSGFERATPYAVGIIKLDEGPSISAQITGDKEAVEIGKRVRMVFRRMYEDGAEGLISYGFKFEIDDKDQSLQNEVHIQPIHQ